jgi:hypothetical protein
MNPAQYDQARNQAQQLEHKIRDYLDDPNSNVGRRLLDEARRIEDEFQTKNNPRSIENRIKSFIHLLDELKTHETPVIDAQHARWLHDQYEHLQLSLRKFENY